MSAFFPVREKELICVAAVFIATGHRVRRNYTQTQDATAAIYSLVITHKHTHTRTNYIRDLFGGVSLGQKKNPEKK